MGGCLSKKNGSYQYDNSKVHRSRNIRPSNKLLKTTAKSRRAATSHHQLLSRLQDRALPPPPNQVGRNNILGKPFEDIRVHHTLGEELGRGESGMVYLCTENSTGRTFACKSIKKRKPVSDFDKECVEREIQIMRQLSGKPNIVQLEGSFEDEQSVHLVMELCAGGTLFDRIIALGTGKYAENAARSIFKQVMNAVQVCHSSGVMHRDLKPENFLLSSKADPLSEITLKVADFGASVFIEEGKVYRDIVGSLYYVAPEVLMKRGYGKEIDIWSAGIILYILLSGEPPFWAETEEGIFDAIRKGRDIDFKSRPWPSISTNAKDLVRKMLTKDPRERITASQVLDHPWIKEGGEASDMSIAIPAQDAPRSNYN